MKDRLVITGMGAVTPIGIGVDEYWKNLISGRNGIDEIKGINTEHMAVKIAAQAKEFNPSDFMPRKKAGELDRFMQMAFAAADEAVKTSEIKIDPFRIGITVGTALDGFCTITSTQKKYENSSIKKVTPRFLAKALGNVCGCHIAMAHNIKGPAMTVNTACASGGDAIALAAMMIITGQADAVVAVGGECAVDEVLAQSLISAQALSPTGSRPFDNSRDGFVIGEGGGAVVIETETHAVERGADILAVLAGWGNNNDAYHEVSPRPDGEGEIRCMKQAIDTAGLQPDDIGYINAHGTATIKGDEAEVLSISSMFGKNTTVGSTKGATGHMMGAGGITEIITCVKAIETGILPPTLNLKNPMSEKIQFVCENAIEKRINYAMSNAFGFGGQNSSIIVGRYINSLFEQ